MSGPVARFVLATRVLVGMRPPKIGCMTHVLSVKHPVLTHLCRAHALNVQHVLCAIEPGKLCLPMICCVVASQT